MTLSAVRNLKGSFSGTHREIPEKPEQAFEIALGNSVILSMHVFPVGVARECDQRLQIFLRNQRETWATADISIPQQAAISFRPVGTHGIEVLVRGVPCDMSNLLDQHAAIDVACLHIFQ